MFAEPHLRWKYWAAWSGSALARSYVLAREGRIVAHAGALPLTYRAGQRTLTLLHPFDWMSEPSAIGSGAALLQRLAKSSDGLLIVGGSAMTQRMIRPLGFRTLDEVTLYAAPVQPAAKTDEGLALQPSDVHSISLTAHPSLDDCEGAIPPAPWLLSLRTPERLSDCATCPAAPTFVYTVRRASARLGGFVLGLAPRQARIVAWWAHSTGDLVSVLRAASRQSATFEGIDEVVCMANLPAERDALAAAAFRATGGVPMYLLSSAAELASDVQIGFQMLDGDVAFLHHGAPQPWLPAAARSLPTAGRP